MDLAVKVGMAEGGVTYLMRESEVDPDLFPPGTEGFVPEGPGEAQCLQSGGLMGRADGRVLDVLSSRWWWEAWTSWRQARRSKVEKTEAGSQVRSSLFSSGLRAEVVAGVNVSWRCQGAEGGRPAHVSCVAEGSRSMTQRPLGLGHLRTEHKVRGE